MTKNDYEMLRNFDKIKEKVICGDDLFPHFKNRTLLYGYTCDRETFHVYLKDKIIHTVIYITRYSDDGKTTPIEMKEIIINSNRDYVPDKRLYPERCDYRFCRLLKGYDVDLPFTVWTDDIEVKDFYGFTLEDI